MVPPNKKEPPAPPPADCPLEQRRARRAGAWTPKILWYRRDEPRRFGELRRTTVREETAAYQNKPVDEILSSPAFDETSPFGEEVSRLLQQRKDAIARHDDARRAAIERELFARNPTYFAYLDLDRRLGALQGAAE